MKNPKHDRQGVRTPVDIERKYNLGDRDEIMEIVTNAQRAATNAQSVANEANATAAQANSTATKANSTASAANTTAGQAKTTAEEASSTATAAKSEVDSLSGNVYTKAQTLSPAVKTLLGLSDTATPSDAFTALYNLIMSNNT